MEKIYSKIEPETLLHIIHRWGDFDTMNDFRQEIVSPDNFIQCAALTMNEGKTFRAHKHIVKETYLQKIAQESWVVLQGKVKCTFYDVDDSILCHPILRKGDVSFTLRGGHTYTILKDDTKVLEFKTGPYLGQEYDKIFI
jgi:hypothetical protein